MFAICIILKNWVRYPSRNPETHLMFPVHVSGMKHVASRFVPKYLNFLQKERRVEAAKEMLANVADDPTIYSSNVFLLVTRRGFMNMKSKKWAKTTMNSFQRVNKEYYLAVLRSLCEAICRKRADLWADNSWIFHHDNAPSHSSLIVTVFLSKHETKVIAQPPYLPDLVPFYIFLFPKLKYPLRRTRHESIEAIKRNSLK